MITHYDMSTGELIASEGDAAAADQRDRPRIERTALRLLTVQESITAQQSERRPAAALVMQPLAWLRGGSG
jgi:hypothetical protein